jgi:hypothetical protein
MEADVRRRSHQQQVSFSRSREGACYAATVVAAVIIIISTIIVTSPATKNDISHAGAFANAERSKQRVAAVRPKSNLSQLAIERPWYQ